MAYRVVRYFEDVTDGRHPYDVGDKYPRDGVKASRERLEALSSDKNRQGVVLIEKVTLGKKPV